MAIKNRILPTWFCQWTKPANINAALRRTNGELILVLDADFVPRTHALWRVVGSFRDPQVACVQTPQYFFNKDPTQINLGLANRWADDQRLFFDIIMQSRDAWGAAFCCGTGFIIRRSAIEAIGGEIPTESVCEDMLTSMELKRHGLETIYLKEELCTGLAPESVRAFFVQRQRWARGQIQILFLRRGTFRARTAAVLSIAASAGLLGQLPARIVYMLVPLIFLLFGVAPLIARSRGAHRPYRPGADRQHRADMVGRPRMLFSDPDRRQRAIFGVAGRTRSTA